MRSNNKQPSGSGAHPFGKQPPPGWRPPKKFVLHGADWATPLMVAERVIALLALSAWSPTDNDEALSTHVYEHIGHLRNVRGSHSSSHAAIVDAVQIMSCLRFDEWTYAEAWLREARATLQSSLYATTHQDGSPRDSPVMHHERMWAAVLAQFTLTSAGHTLSEDSLSLLCRIMQFLVNFSGPSGTLPLLGETTPKIGQQEFPTTLSTIGHIVHRWFGISCPGVKSADATAHRLGCASDFTNPWPIPRHWTAHKWEGAGLSTVHNQMNRLVTRASDQSFWWAVDGHPMLHGSATNGVRNRSALRTVRTDDRVAIVEFTDRRIRIEGSRLTVVDPPSTERKRIHFPTGSVFTANDKGHTVTHERGLFDVRSEQGWCIDEDSLVRAPNEGESTIRIEYRRS